jgi:hypothetical protein
MPYQPAPIGGFGANPPGPVLPGAGQTPQPAPGFGSNPPGPVDPGQLQQLMAMRNMMTR